MIIAHIGPQHLPILFTRGGATERRMRETAAMQAQAGHRVLIYSAEDQSGQSEYRGAEIHAIQCKLKGVPRAGEFLIKSILDCRRHNPDIIHFHTLAEGAAFTKLFAGSLKAKTVLSFDFFEFRRGKSNPFFSWYRQALSSFSALLPVSDYCKREAATYWSLPEDRMQVLYNGVSLDQFSPNPESAAERRQALGIAPQEIIALYVGRVCEQKGTDLLVNAYAKLRAQGSNLRLVVAGPIGQFGQGDESQAAGVIHTLRQNDGLYLGPVEEAVLPSVYNMADIFVLPTRSHEMFGMAAIEAQACGRPVICSNHGGLPEVIQASSGLLFPSGDMEALTQQLRLLTENAAMRMRFQEAAVENAKRFAWPEITQQLQQVYQNA
jgi:glycosyltransferase involved in cell wall biosynthesis